MTAVRPLPSVALILATASKSARTVGVSPDSAACISMVSRACWSAAGVGVGIVCGVIVIDISGDWFTVGMEVEVEIAGLVTCGEVVGAAMQLASHREYTINKDTVLGIIVTTVRPLPFLTKIGVYFLRGHERILPLLPTHP